MSGSLKHPFASIYLIVCKIICGVVYELGESGQFEHKKLNVKIDKNYMFLMVIYNFLTINKQYKHANFINFLQGRS